MWINTPESKQLVSEFSKEIIAEIAPEELDLVDDLLDDFYSNPVLHENKDNPLGFGTEFLAASTPVVAMALQTFFIFVLKEVWTTAQKEGASLVAQKMKALFKKGKTEPELELSREQLERARELVKREAIRAGMTPRKAEDLALRIIGRIALNS